MILIEGLSVKCQRSVEEKRRQNFGKPGAVTVLPFVKLMPFPSYQREPKIKNYWNHYATQYQSQHGNFKAKLYGFKLKNKTWCATCGEDVAKLRGMS